MDRLIGREQRLEILSCKCMRVQRLRLEDHEVRDINDADTQGGARASQDGRSSDDFEHHFAADADEDNVRVQAVVCAGELPDRCSGLAMSVCFVGGEKDRDGLLGADHEVDVIDGAETVG